MRARLHQETRCTKPDGIVVTGGNTHLQGNVGIGTASPSAKLHISETTGTTHSANNGTLILDHKIGGASSIVLK